MFTFPLLFYFCFGIIKPDFIIYKKIYFMNLKEVTTSDFYSKKLRF